MDKSPDAFRTIREVAESMDLPQHVLRFWETRFPQIKPLKRGGGRRYYRPDDVELLRAIKQLLYGEGYTIKGVQKLIKEQGVRALASGAPSLLSADPDARQTDLSSDFGAPPPVIFQRPQASETVAASHRDDALSGDNLEMLRGALRELAEGRRVLGLALENSPA